MSLSHTFRGLIKNFKLISLRRLASLLKPFDLDFIARLLHLWLTLITFMVV